MDSLILGSYVLDKQKIKASGYEMHIDDTIDLD
jgi:hypothetical protein